MNLEEITPLILTFNEQENIGRTLSGLTWAKRVIVLDSGSTDRTFEIAHEFPNVDWQYRAFDNHAGQCNYALEELADECPWILSMDADYQVPREFAGELTALQLADDVSGGRAKFIYCVNGRPLRGGLYPERVVLYRPSRARYIQEGHAHLLQIHGRVVDLKSRLLHDDRKPMKSFVSNQRRYAALEARWLCSKAWLELRWSDRARRLMFVAPWLAPLMVLVVRGGLLDGLSGLRYAAERAFAEAMVSWELIKLMASRSPGK